MLNEPKSLIDLVKSALPHQSKFIDQYGVDGLAFLIEELEETLLSELRRSLNDPDGDKQSLEQAAAILKAADKLAEVSKPDLPIPPTVVK